jgi:cobalamin biosynthesis protein CobD/CbiB
MSVRKTWVLAGLLAASVVPSIVFAQAKQSAQAVRAPATAQRDAPAVRITPAARDAVAVVTRFFDALSKGDLAGAREQLDPGVVVITNATIRGAPTPTSTRSPSGDCFAGMRKATGS